MMRLDSRSTTSTTRGSLSQRAAQSLANARRLDVVEFDRATLDLRHDLGRDDHDVAIRQWCTARGRRIDDLGGDVVTGFDLRESGDAENSQTTGRSLVDIGVRHGRTVPDRPTWGDGRSCSTTSRLRDLRPGGLARRLRLRLHRHHLPPRRRRRGRADRLRPTRDPQRVPPAHGRRAVHRARPRPDVDRRRVRAAHRQRPVGEGRRLGVLLRRRPAHPRQGRLQVRRGDDRRHDRTGPGRAPPHPRGAAPDPVHAQGGHLCGSRLGGRRWPLAARRVRPHAGQHRACPVQADRRRRGQLRRRVRVGLPRPPGRPEVRPRDLLPRPRVHRRRHGRDGRGQRLDPARRTRSDGAAVGTRDLRQEPDGAAHAEVLVQPDRRRPRRPADLRRRGHPTRLRHRRGRGGPRQLPREAPRPDWSPYPYHF